MKETKSRARQWVEEDSGKMETVDGDKERVEGDSKRT